MRRIFSNLIEKWDFFLFVSQTQRPSLTWLFWTEKHKYKTNVRLYCAWPVSCRALCTRSIPPVGTLQCCKTSAPIHDSTYKTARWVPLENNMCSHIYIFFSFFKPMLRNLRSQIILFVFQVTTLHIFVPIHRYWQVCHDPLYMWPWEMRFCANGLHLPLRARIQAQCTADQLHW